MNCRRAKKLINDFVDGLCDETVRIELERHLSDCESCDKLASQLTRSLDLLKRTPVVPVDDNFNWRVRLAIRKELATVREATTSQRGLFRSWNAGYAASAVAGFAVILIAGWFVAGSMNAPTFVGSLDELAKSKQPTAETKESAKIPRPASPTMTVSQGGSAMKSNDAARGAIDFANEGVRDSLVNEAVKGMTPEDRMRYFRKHIRELQMQMENRNNPNR